MAKRPTRLRFTEDDLADSRVKKAADRADKAVDKAEKATDKLASKKAKPKLKLETDAAGSRKAKLRFEKAEFTEIERPSVAKHMASRGAAVTLTSKAHRAVSEYEDDNIGVQAVQETTKAVESTAYTVDHAVYSHKLKAYDKADKLVEKSDKANVNALYEKFKKDNPDARSNPFSRWQQKRAIKKEYAAAKSGKNTASTTASASKGAGKATGKAAQGVKNITEKVSEFCTTHSKTILFVLIAGLLFMILSGMFSSCSAMFQGGTQIILGTSFTAKEEDIIGADNDYKALEAALRNEINNIERTHSGYDEYRYDLDEINHNPYELAAYLTVKFEDYTRDEVQATLQWLFEQQYELTLTEVGYIHGFEADIKTVEAHPQIADGFCGMEIMGKAYTEKADAGEILIAACKDTKSADQVPLGSYRGFQMELSFDSFRNEFDVTLKGAVSHRVALGTDARGNITRLDNALAGIPERLERANEQLNNLYNQQEAAKAEVGKPFPQEAELTAKSQRLAELDAALNMEDSAEKHDERSESERPSVLADLKSKAEHIPPAKYSEPREEVL